MGVLRSVEDLAVVLIGDLACVLTPNHISKEDQVVKGGQNTGNVRSLFSLVIVQVSEIVTQSQGSNCPSRVEPVLVAASGWKWIQIAGSKSPVGTGNSNEGIHSAGQ
jgi:hypothetical protein